PPRHGTEYPGWIGYRAELGPEHASRPGQEPCHHQLFDQGSHRIGTVRVAFHMPDPGFHAAGWHQAGSAHRCRLLGSDEDQLYLSSDWRHRLDTASEHVEPSCECRTDEKPHWFDVFIR